MQQDFRNEESSRNHIIELDVTPPPRRVEITLRRRLGPIALTPMLGDPDDLTPPLTDDIMNDRLTRRFKMPTIKIYDGTGDPANIINTIKCRAFSQTLGACNNIGIVIYLQT